jgi:hypothetical protein
LACAATGPSYEEVKATAPGPTANSSRIIFLRPKDRYDDYSASPAAVLVDDEQVGRLAYGGFFFVDVEPGPVSLKVQADSAWHGVCHVEMQTKAGETVFFDVGPRTSHVVAGAVGAVIGGVLAPVSSSAVGTGVSVAAASTAGGEVAEAVENQRQVCAGPYGIRPLPESQALRRIADLAWSK